MLKSQDTSKAMEQEMMNNNTAFVGASETKALSDSPSFGNSSVSSLESADSDSFDGEVTSSYSSPSFADLLPVNNDPVLDMSSLIGHLPVKRGLSKHYHGKSRSFTSLADVRSLEDLAKPENPYAKKMKLRASTRSHIEGGIFKSSRVSCPSISARRANPYLVITIRPTTPPHHSTTTIPKKQTPLLA